VTARAYYNENDRKAAAWLRELIKAGLIADGDVDERSVEDVQASDLVGFTQCHFFAGIGGWSYALRLAGWPDDRECWTGSCPCQPFSNAGKGYGADDSRHLWPAWFRLIQECSPSIVFGEQVASSDGLAWLDAVCADMEAEGYAIGAVDCCAAGVGAPHRRQRLWFVADTGHTSWRSHGWGGFGVDRQERIQPEWAEATSEPRDSGEDGELADPERWATERFRQLLAVQTSGVEGSAQERERLRTDTWDGCEFVECRDGKSRPVEPGTFPLAHGIPARVGRLRGYGNAIVPQVAAEVIGAYMDITA